MFDRIFVFHFECRFLLKKTIVSNLVFNFIDSCWIDSVGFDHHNHRSSSNQTFVLFDFDFEYQRVKYLFLATTTTTTTSTTQTSIYF